MANFSFPTIKATRLVSRTPFFETTVNGSDSGAEFRIKRREVGYRYRLECQCVTANGEHTDLFGHFEACGGMQSSFLFVDPVTSRTVRVRYDQDELDVTVEPSVVTVGVELVTVVVP